MGDAQLLSLSVGAIGSGTIGTEGIAYAEARPPRPPRSPREPRPRGETFHLQSTPANTVLGGFPIGLPPALTIKSGDTVRIDAFSSRPSGSRPRTSCRTPSRSGRACRRRRASVPTSARGRSIWPARNPETRSRSRSSTSTSASTASGRFAPTDVASMPTRPSDPTDIRFGDWRHLEVDYMVVGRVAMGPRRRARGRVPGRRRPHADDEVRVPDAERARRAVAHGQ